jgi:hypothetical protein
MHVELKTSTCVVSLDDRSGSLMSCRAVAAPDQEFLVPGHGRFPLFVIQYLDHEERLQEISSLEAASVSLSRVTEVGGESVRIAYEHVGVPDLSVTATVRVSQDDLAIRWEIAVSMTRAVVLLNVQYPYLVVAYDLAGDPDASKLLQPFYFGLLHEQLRPHHFPPDFPDLWQLLPENGDSSHYPGLTFAQLLAYYNERAGLLLFCRDNTGQVKLIKPVHHEPGLRLGIAHVVGWTDPGNHDLNYEVALQGFLGDWYNAAEIYRAWSLQQPWARTPLAERKDLPAWLADAPLHIVLRIQGEVDAGPTHTHPEFTPFEHAVPLLERVADRVGTSLVPVIMAWERPGPWVYPDCFPPVGGEESLTAFTAAARERGWHVGTYCNGTRWVTAHKWSGYRGEAFFEEQGGPASVCRQPDGSPWSSSWDQPWRPSYTGCLGSERTKDLLWRYAATLRGYRLGWIQILDQNVGCSTFPCYAKAHDHPPAPGGWMTTRMEQLLVGLREGAERAGWDGAWSVETPCSEYFLQSFVMCDVRPDFRTSFVPLYYYLYHDYIMTQSMFGAAPNPYFLVLKFARAFVLGDVLGCHMGQGGRLQNWDPPRGTFWGEPWMDWDRPAGDQDAAFAVLRNATALRRGMGKDFLLFGRMLRPLPVTNIPTKSWSLEGEANAVPAVEHATWQARDGRVAVALANWTDDEQIATVDLSTLEEREATLYLSTDGLIKEASVTTGQPVELSLPPHACALLVSA